MKVLELADYDTGEVLDLITLSPDGKVSYDTGRGESLIANLVAQGMSPSEAFEMRTGWSNGYLTSKLI